MVYSMKRCNWCNLNNDLYVLYHDKEWGFLRTDDSYLFEMLLLEMFQAGLSWECVLNKREYFREAFSNFDISLVSMYDDKKVYDLLLNKNIIRNKRKILASINNAKVFISIVLEYGSFYNYLNSFIKDIIYEVDKTSNDYSDKISCDLKKRGMSFVGTKIIYSFLQAIGLIYSHDKECFLYKEK